MNKLLELLKKSNYYIAGNGCRFFVNDDDTFSIFSNGLSQMEQVTPMYYGTDLVEAIRIFEESESYTMEDLQAKLKNILQPPQ